jgi:hypothetical protein
VDPPQQSAHARLVERVAVSHAILGCGRGDEEERAPEAVPLALVHEEVERVAEIRATAQSPQRER